MHFDDALDVLIKYLAAVPESKAKVADWLSTSEAGRLR